MRRSRNQRSADSFVRENLAPEKKHADGLSALLLPGGIVAVALNPGIIDTEMLRSTFGGSATSYPKPQEWAMRAVPFILSMTRENASSKNTVP